MYPHLTLDEPQMIALTVAAALVAGAVRGFSGFGGPALMMLLLTQFYSPVSVVTKIAVMDAMAYLLLIPSTAREFNRRIVAVVTLSTLVGLPVGAYLLTQTDPAVMKRAIAGVIAAGVIVMLLGGRFRASPPVAVHIGVGLLAGLVFGATYIALVAVIFFFSLPASGAESRANAVFWGVLLSLVFIATHMALGNIAAEGLWRMILLGFVYLAGTAAGAWWFRRTGERGFRRAVLWLLLGLAAVGLVA